MSATPFVAEIWMFAGNFPPKGNAFCNGQLLPLSQNTALFSLLGTTYGGDGKSTFALPNLQGSAPMQQGQGQGLSLRDLGEQGGSQSVTLLVSEIPVHTHSLQGFSVAADHRPPGPTEVLARSNPGTIYHSSASLAQMAPQGLSTAGGSLPHQNMQPFLTLTFVIALQGVFPPRS
jgi:microcystin-dependent protein